jgi:aldose 1-epimerase
MAVVIRNERLSLGITPDLGGSFTHFSLNSGDAWVDLMRPALEGFTSSSDASSFLMAPYPNRIRDGKFAFAGETYQLRFPEKHAIHGDVRNRPWKIEEASPTAISLSFHSPDFKDINYPFPFSIRQRCVVHDSSLHVSCCITNEGTTAMPAGCGFHPYFNRALSGHSEEVEIQFQAAGVYPFTGAVPLPDGMAKTLTPELAFSVQRVLPESLDHCFSGWQGRAVMTWPQSKVRLVMEASPNFGHLVLYSPPGKSFFALEPQSQMNDGFNFLARGEQGTGVVVLQPQERLEVWFSLRIEEV